MQRLIIYGGEMGDSYLVPQVLLPVTSKDDFALFLDVEFAVPDLFYFGKY